MNIKEIGKELMGKSLNSYHRKLGLTQLEENNKMQDGILNGILSQVDDAYIERTEESNVMHLDGSGDGVVVLDSIEGNTMVNCITTNIDTNIKFIANGTAKRFDYKVIAKDNTVYTLIANITKNTINHNLGLIGWHIETNNKQVIVPNGFVGLFKQTFITKANISENWYMDFWKENTEGEIELNKFMILEGDWTDKEVNYYKGLQSSFEEKVNSEGKYEIEILLNNKNLLNFDNVVVMDNLITEYKVDKNTNSIVYKKASTNANNGFVGVWVNVKPNTNYKLSYDKINGGNIWVYTDNFFGNSIIQGGIQPIFNSENNSKLLIGFYTHTDGNIVNEYRNVMLRENNTNSNFILPKQNKIKLLINEPLRAVDNTKDRLCIKDGKLMIERNIFEFIEDGSNDWSIFDIGENRQFYKYIPINLIKKSVNEYSKITSMSNNYGKTTFNERGNITSRNCALMTYSNSNNTNLLCIYKPLDFTTEQLKTELNNSPLKMCYQLAEPTYEEVLNEYGEPIILEGYENGTLYIDSVIVPTTTVKYTPKMASFNTLKEVSDNNTMLTNDINDNIIPYLMDVDLMIMEKEMALMSQYKVRRIGESDMTSMQKRTQDMLERLIKGKTLTEQECKTRVTTYLNAGKITDAQAEELMLLISEIYA